MGLLRGSLPFFVRRGRKNVRVNNPRAFVRVL
jgi:hypothetical protein